MIPRLVLNRAMARKSCGRRSLSSSLTEILQQVSDGTLDARQAESMILRSTTSTSTPEQTLQSFANLDHTRTGRTGFPEAVFGSGKTPEQVAYILDDMARALNEKIQQGNVEAAQRAILATR
jgi:NCAIR mutase (PurE)-related protein